MKKYIEKSKNDKKALIAVNFISFASFLRNDIDILLANGYQIFIIGHVIPGESISFLTNKGIIVLDCAINSKNPFSLNNIKYFWSIKKILRKEHFLLIHCHTPIVGFLTRIACKHNFGAKVIYTTHGLPFLEEEMNLKNRLFKLIEKIGSKLSDGIITINQTDFKYLSTFCKCQCFYIPGVGVDIEKFRTTTANRFEICNQFGIDSRKILILSVGEISERKNHMLILKALSKMDNKKDYVYIICGRELGSTSITNQLISFAKENQIDLRLLGHRSDVNIIMSIVDFGALPSIREGLGLSGIEQLSCGKPLIGTAVQGIKDYVINGINGYLFDAKSVDSVIFAIKKCTILSRKANAQLIKDSVNKFSLSSSKLSLEKIYRKFNII